MMSDPGFLSPPVEDRLAKFYIPLLQPPPLFGTTRFSPESTWSFFLLGQTFGNLLFPMMPFSPEL